MIRQFHLNESSDSSTLNENLQSNLMAFSLKNEFGEFQYRADSIYLDRYSYLKSLFTSLATIFPMVDKNIIKSEIWNALCDSLSKEKEEDRISDDENDDDLDDADKEDFLDHQIDKEQEKSFASAYDAYNWAAGINKPDSKFKLGPPSLLDKKTVPVSSKVEINKFISTLPTSKEYILSILHYDHSDRFALFKALDSNCNLDRDTLSKVLEEKQALNLSAKKAKQLYIALRSIGAIVSIKPNPLSKKIKKSRKKIKTHNAISLKKGRINEKIG